MTIANLSPLITNYAQVRSQSRQGQNISPSSDFSDSLGTESCSESNDSSFATSRSESPDNLQVDKEAISRIYKQWKEFGPGSEFSTYVGNEQFLISRQNIGTGANKIVHAAHSEAGHAVAILYARITNEQQRQLIENEVKALTFCETMNIPGTLRRLDPFIRIGEKWGRFATNFCEEGTLNHWAINQPLSKRLEIMHSVAKTLEELHHRDCAHNDVKSENIGITNGKPILMDFGLFTDNASNSSPKGVTMAYLAPRHLVPSNALQADVFSFGATLYEMTSDNISCGSLCQTVMKNNNWDNSIAYVFNASQGNIDLAISQLNCSDELKILLGSLLKINPQERITIRQAREALEKMF
ncbi:MAG TPA: protein kinase family protein [Chlamydiales bacterium]|nr:protein kinase family protein [Chlamydiales bacterium]